MDPRPLTDAFRTETEPSDLQAARVQARLRASAAAPSSSPSRAWVFGAGLLSAGIPALVALALLRGPTPDAGGLAATGPETVAATSPAASGSLPPAPASLAAALDAPAGPVELAAADGVALRYEGHGRLSGTAAAPRIDWSTGTLHVEVEPGRGLDVQVKTREGRVRVVGTGFTVARDATGTSVGVSHGRVEVTCGDEPAVYLSRGEARTCLPVSAAGRLARARALREAGESPLVVLQEARDALDVGHESVVVEELRFLELELLVELGRADEARAVGAALLASPDVARGPEVTALLDRLGADR